MPINSWQFLILAAMAIVTIRLLTEPLARRLALLAFSLVFMATYITTLRSALTVALFLATVFVLGLQPVRTAIGWSGRTVVGTIVGLWAFLFLIKDPALLAPANPFFHAPVTIIGISYLVFRSISYLMEAELTQNRSLLDYLNYMLFFPTILAGPIERFKPFTEQYALPNNTEADVLPALHRIANGYIKKFAIADNLAAFSVAGIADPAHAAIPVLWIAALSQLFLIFLDFSGYCDIAIGIASLMGIKIRENFDRPFASINIKEFWERWHMSMSSLMRDYIFTPVTKVIVSTKYTRWHWPMIVAAYCGVMMLIALWHGTTTGFLVFGLLHGAVLAAIQILQKRRPRGPTPKLTPAQRWFWRIATYIFVSISLVLWMAVKGQWFAYYCAMLGIK